MNEEQTTAVRSLDEIQVKNLKTENAALQTRLGKEG